MPRFTSSFISSHFRVLLLLTLLLGLFFYLLPLSTAQAAHCGTGAAGFDTSASPGPVTVRIYLQNKATQGTDRFRGDTVEACIYHNAAGTITLNWQADTGITIGTATGVANNTHLTLTLPFTYTGGACVSTCPLVSPIRFLATNATAVSDATDYFFFSAPFLPDAISAGTPTLDYVLRPRYAISGQVYNPVFNSAEPTDLNSYYPNAALNENYGVQRDRPGLYIDDYTVASQGYLPANQNQWALFYWWVRADQEFPKWQVKWEQSTGLSPSGGTMTMDSLLALQGRVFSPDENYYGYIALVLDRTTTDLANNGFWSRVCPACTTAARDFFGVWLPVNSGTYSSGAGFIPEKLNGGYLGVVEQVGETIIEPNNLTISRGYRSAEDVIIGGDVSFYERTNNSGVDYKADLINTQGVLVSSFLLANTDSVLFDRVPYAFWINNNISGSVLISEDNDNKLPMLLIDLDTGERVNLTTSFTDNAALEGYIAALRSTGSRTSVLDAFTNFASAWGLGEGPGTFLIVISTLLIAALAFFRFLPSFSAIILLLILGAVFFTLLGLLQPWVLMLIIFAMGLGIIWQVVIRGA
jgi:hypothetical protein